MSRVLTVWLAGLALTVAAQVSQVAQAAITLTDDRGAQHRWDQPPARIVSLLPSLTETLCDMGACARLVGVDRYSNFPATVQALPHLGGLDDVSVERVVALRPDVVVASPSSRVVDRLSALGIAVVVLDPRTQADVERVALKLGQMVGQPEAGPRLWRRLQAQIGAAAQSVPPQARGLRVYYEVDSAPYAAGASSFIGDLLAQMGLVNIVPANMGPFPKLNPEFVVRADPQLILVSARQEQALPQRPGWAGISAVKQRHICGFSAEQRDVLSRPGPRLGEAAHIMAACVRRMTAGQP